MPQAYIPLIAAGVGAAASMSVAGKQRRQAQKMSDQARADRAKQNAIVEKQKLETRLPAVIRENQELINYTDRLPDLFNRIIELSSKDSTGGVSGKAKSGIVGTDQYKLNNLIGELQSFVGLNRLIGVKKAGGTFGSLSENELRLLIDALGSLDPYQDHKTTMKTLENIHKNYNNSMTVAKTTFVQEYGEDEWNNASWNTKDEGVTQYKLLPPLGAVKLKSR